MSAYSKLNQTFFTSLDNKESTKSTQKTKKNICASQANDPANPPNPSTPATTAIMNKVSAKFNIMFSLIFVMIY